MEFLAQLTRLLIGTNRRGAILTVASGLLFGVGAWVGYPPFGAGYWPLPHLVLEWGFVVGFVGLAAGVAYARAGFVAAWWVTIPAHVALSHYVYADGFVVLPFRSDVLSSLVIAGMMAFVYAVLGSGLGIASRWAVRTTCADRSGGDR